MNWDDVKKAYPSQWALIEAIEARTENDRRIIDKMDVVESFGDDGDRAFKRYIELHRLHKEREYFIYHTSHETLDLKVKRWMGVRL